MSEIKLVHIRDVGLLSEIVLRNGHYNTVPYDAEQLKEQKE